MKEIKARITRRGGKSAFPTVALDSAANMFADRFISELDNDIVEVTVEI